MHRKVWGRRGNLGAGVSEPVGSHCIAKTGGGILLVNTSQPI
jgi:hypothetical protein